MGLLGGIFWLHGKVCLHMTKFVYILTNFICSSALELSLDKVYLQSLSATPQVFERARLHFRQGLSAFGGSLS